MKEQQKALRKQVAPYEKSNRHKSITQLFNTLVPFVLLWIGAYYLLEISIWLSLGLSVIAGGFLVRVFIIFHDCCHHSFFKNRKVNKIIGTMTGVLTLFPYSKWGHEHSVHHATSGNLDKRGVGDIWMMTVDEYASASQLEKLQYRLYRNPFVMFVLGPIFVFLIQNRFNRKGARRKERMNTYLTNLLIVASITLLCLTIGWQSFLLVQGPIFLVSGIAGVWLFYVQHTFEDSYFEVDQKWNYVLASVEGSSYYKLPKLLQWLTGNIGYHHVHHLSPRVPNYQLEKVHNEVSPLQHVPTITIKTSIASLKYHLWDENQKKFVGFRAAKKVRLGKVS
ncbi:fatty acid desaturase [Alkalihalobacillus trypoxylicola]|uniref:Fatty acid desaturase n=1 Tax=Alkalihalobacillus trypoxylicola TaxID=519424 RepID=A0A162F477_9BACI|nr:fatty acid desaturase [Alkalihalobacillus trypoxylicola]KYG34772.1 fatty acid desaturase [Alkalihalobacillus trypoxylicola]